MNRLEAWARDLGNEDSKRSVLDIALEVHSRLCGAMEVGDLDDLKMKVDALRRRLNKWSPSILNSNLFDDAVRLVMHAAINDWRTSHWNVD